MRVLYIITGLLTILSLVASPRQTGRALRVALRRFLKITPVFLAMLMLVAAALYLVPEHVLEQMLARENKWIAAGSALGAGSVSLMPGFIAFPLCGILRDQGALYMVLSAFSATLMMVGVVTFPLERFYLGPRLALCRNAAGLILAIVTALATGFFFGELP